MRRLPRKGGRKACFVKGIIPIVFHTAAVLSSYYCCGAIGVLTLEGRVVRVQIRLKGSGLALRSRGKA